MISRSILSIKNSQKLMLLNKCYFPLSRYKFIISTKFYSNAKNNLTEQKLVDQNFDKDKNSNNYEIKNEKEESIQKDHKQHKPLLNKPFIKTLFTGDYLFDYLKFPEYDYNYQLENLNQKYALPLKSFIENSKYEDMITQNGNFSISSFNSFKQLNLFSMSFPKDYNGTELDATGVTRMIEICSVYPSLGINLIYNNEIASKCILLYGNREQKDKYLKRLSSGDLKLGFCYSEPENGFDVANFDLISQIDNTSLAKDQQKYVLNGKKSWVTLIDTDQTNNKSIKSDLGLIVVSKTDNPKQWDDNDSKKNLNVFVIDANTSGIKFNKKYSSQTGLNLYEIEFDNVKVGNDCLLGELNSGFEITSKIIENSRYLVGAICVAILKDFLKETVAYCMKTRRFDKSIAEYSSIKERLAHIETSLYTMESMTYLTAGIVDSYQHADVGVESALTKIFCTETLKTSINECLKIMSMSGITNLNKMRQNYLSDLNSISTVLNNNDLLRLYASTNGIVLAGVEFGDSVRKLRNPFMNPGYFLRQTVAHYRLNKACTKKTPEYLYLWEHLHPSLEDQSRLLEQSAVKFILSVKATLINMGRETTDSQTQLKYLADMSMHIYAMNAACSRASRSYSIGLPNGQHELALALIQSYESAQIIDRLAKNIANYRTGTTLDNVLINVADQVIKSKEHAAVHCLNRNY